MKFREVENLINRTPNRLVIYLVFVDGRMDIVCEILMTTYLARTCYVNKSKFTEVLNDPLGQPTVRPAVKICFVLLDMQSGDGRRTREKTVITTIATTCGSTIVGSFRFYLTIKRY